MDKVERIKMVKAMEFIARQVNDEEVFESWLICGVGDGDIEYGDLVVNSEDLDGSGAGYYIEDDDTFAGLMHEFLDLMKAACKSGGLYCDGVIDKEEE